MFGTTRDNYGLDNVNFAKSVIPKLESVFKFATPFIISENVIYSDKAFYKYKYQDKKILILGGGGSTSRLLPNLDLSAYDYIWSLNNFYKNEFIRKNVRIDLFSVGPEVDLTDNVLLEYLNLNYVTAAFELHEKWARSFNNPETGQTPQQLLDEAANFYKDDFKIAFQTKFYSQLGGGARLIIFAGELGVSKIDFTGFDGPNAIRDKDHAFEQGKGKFSQFVTPMPHNSRIQFFQNQYDFFWQYMYREYPNLILTPLEYNEIHRKLYEISNSRV